MGEYMFPYLNLFGRELPMYAVMAIIGIFAGGIFACREVKKRGLDDNDCIVFLLVAAVGVFFGGHILYGITNIQNFYLFSKVTDIKAFVKVVNLLFGGSVFYGGLIGGIIAGLIYLKVKKMNIPLYCDIMGAAIPLLHGFARIGCFFGGCCYGIECAFGFTFTNSLIPEANGVSRFPVQLLESLCEFILFAVIFYLLRKGILKERLLPLYLAVYAVIRFLDEFLRGDSIRGFVFGLSTSQFICIFVFVFSVGFIIIKSKKMKTQQVKL